MIVHETKMLEYLCEDADMGRSAIGHVLNMTDDAELRQVLEQQQSAYQKSYDAAAGMLHERGEKAPQSAPLSRAMTSISSDLQTMTNRSPSKISSLVIQGSTMGITTLTKQLHQYAGQDPKIAKLAHQQIQMEQQNIDDLKAFL